MGDIDYRWGCIPSAVVLGVGVTVVEMSGWGAGWSRAAAYCEQGP